MRGKGEGSVYQRGDGYWCGSIENGRYPNGRRRKARVVRRYKRDVLGALDQLRRQAQDGVVPDRTRTLAAYLDWWLTDVLDDVSSATRGKYEQRLRGNVIPRMGHVKLGKLAPAHVVALRNQLAQDHGPNTVRVTLSTLRQALDWAVGAELIARNPAATVKATKTATARTDDTLTADDAQAVLKAAEGHELYALVWLALKYGLRIGELLALRWSDIGPEVMKVRKSKTAAGERDVPLIEEATAVLDAHRKRQTVAPIGGYVFAKPDGRPLNDQRVREHWSELLERAGVVHLCRSCGDDATPCSTSVRRFHVSRHTAATLLLNAGVELEVVSAILGHASIGITADIYAKPLNDLKRKGLRRLA